jgi:hypothetical protein
MCNRLMTISAAGILFFSAGFAKAQTTAPAKEKKTGTSEAAKSTPRMPDGHPDLNGQWHHRIGDPEAVPLIKPGESYNEKAANAPSPLVKQGDELKAALGSTTEPRPVYKAEYVAKVKNLEAHSRDDDPAWSCGPPGVPRVGPPQKIIQTSKEIVFLYDDLSGNFFRVVRMNSPHRKDIEPTADGDSVGHWEGDTLVVDVNNLDDSTWLTYSGSFHTDKLHVTERLRREGDTLYYEFAAEDPSVLAEPFVEKRVLPLMKDYEIEEAPPCIEKDKPYVEEHQGEQSTR